MGITIDHPLLQRDILEALAGAPLGLESGKVSFDGLKLLKYTSQIENKLHEIRNYAMEYPDQLIRLTLFSLLYDFVNDAQTFESYDTLWLRSNGYLPTDPGQFYNHSYPTFSNISRQPSDTLTQPSDIPYLSTRDNPQQYLHELLFWDNQRYGTPPQPSDIPSLLSEAPSPLSNPLGQFHPTAHNIEEALLDAISEGCTLKVRSMLSHATIISPNLPHQPIFIFQAVRQGLHGITKLLLQHDADANCLQDAETPLSIAAKSGSDSLIRLLLSYGGDVHIATSLLRIDNATGAINRLDQLSRQHFPSSMPMRIEARRKVRHLRTNFWKEHAHISDIVKIRREGHSIRMGPSDPIIKYILWIPPTRDTVPQYWVNDFEDDVHKAWAIGFRTLRGLCNKQLPRNLNETLLFLCLARSMAMDFNDEQLETQFFDDLPRWQILFNNDKPLLHDFIKAVREIWNVDLNRFQPLQLNDIELFASTLQEFQDFALRLRNWADKHWDFQHLDDWGLLATQARWRMRQGHFSAASSDPVQDEVRSIVDQDPIPISTAPQDENMKDPPEPQPPDQTGDISTVLALVLAGAVFAIAIAFWLSEYTSRLFEAQC